MKLLSVVLLGCLCAAGATAPALAQQDMPQSRDLAAARRHGGMHRPLPAQSEARMPKSASEQHGPGDVPLVQQVTAQRTETAQEPGHERLTAEERRQLRRDINAAGREIYSHPR